MEEGDKIRVQYYMMGTPTNTKDYVVEKFRHCLGIFKTKNDRISGRFTPLCNMYEDGAESERRYLPNYGEYYTNQIQGWMDIPK